MHSTEFTIGMLDRVVKTIIADSQSKTTNSTVSSNSSSSVNASDAERDAPSTMMFKATIELNAQQLALQRVKFSLAAGMQLSAEIIEGKRTVLQYLPSPVQRVTSEAGMER